MQSLAKVSCQQNGMSSQSTDFTSELSDGYCDKSFIFMPDLLNSIEQNNEKFVEKFGRFFDETTHK